VDGQTPWRFFDEACASATEAEAHFLSTAWADAYGRMGVPVNPLFVNIGAAISQYRDTYSLSWLALEEMARSLQSLRRCSDGAVERSPSRRRGRKSRQRLVLQKIAELKNDQAEISARLNSATNAADCLRLVIITRAICGLERGLNALTFISRLIEWLLSAILRYLRQWITSRCTFLMQRSWFFYHASIAPPTLRQAQAVGSPR